MEHDESEESPAINPSLPEHLNLDLKKMKGDAIGDTLYSERWVLKTLMKVIQFTDEKWNEEFESELCSLWDMTLEKDVVNFLLGQNIFVIIYDAIKLSNNPRFIEILVGILGNMCCVEKVRIELLKRKESVSLLLSLFDGSDPQILVQLVRLLHSIAWDLTNESSLAAAWLESELSNAHLTTHLVFILNSSTNEELLCCTLEFLNTLCGLELNDKDFTHYFCSPAMVEGLIESWKELTPEWRSGEDLPGRGLRKAASHWTSLLSAFTGHEAGRTILCNYGEQLGAILKKIISRPDDCLDDILISAVSVLSTIVEVYFDETVFRKLLYFLNFLYQNIDESEVFDESSENLQRLLLNYIENFFLAVRVKVPSTVLQETLSTCPENHVLLFWKLLSDRQTEESDGGERTI